MLARLWADQRYARYSSHFADDAAWLPNTANARYLAGHRFWTYRPTASTDDPPAQRPSHLARPGFDHLMKAITRREITWSRHGRSIAWAWSVFSARSTAPAATCTYISRVSTRPRRPAKHYSR